MTPDDDRKTPVPAARDTQLPYDREQDARLTELDARITAVVSAHARRRNAGLLLGAVAVVIAVASLAVAAQPALHRPSSPATVTQTCPPCQCPACTCPAPSLTCPAITCAWPTATDRRHRP